MAKRNSNQLHCSFCGRGRNEVQILVAGQDGNICEDCAEHAMQIVDEEVGRSGENNNDSSEFKKTNNGKFQIKRPREIKAFLDEYVIGQEEAKKSIAVAVYNHYKRIQHKVKETDIELEKSNLILVGETGTGKTLIAKTVAKLINVPFCIVDATLFTEAGYVGEDVESILTRLLQVCDYDINQAEQGIVFIDEIDKISRKSDNPSLTRDIKEGTQQALLKLLEGTDVLVPPQGGRKHPDQKMVKVNTKNILFICGGAFEGVDKIIAKRVRSNSIGFNVDRGNSDMSKDNLLQYVNAIDLKSFGLIPELLGRLPVITYLNNLTAEALRNILTDPKNAILKQYAKIFELEGINLTVEEEAINYIVQKAMDFKLGARGLRSICESIFMDAMYEMPGGKESEYILTLNLAKQKFEKSKLNTLKVA
jgi:ATP-dependent Clp protease ATP-binding subunit ClpX